MKYSDGQEVLLRDEVRLAKDDVGIVVCSIDRDEYTAANPKKAWGYLKKGVIIDYPQLGYVYYDKPYEDLELICRFKE